MEGGAVGTAGKLAARRSKSKLASAAATRDGAPFILLPTDTPLVAGSMLVCAAIARGGIRDDALSAALRGGIALASADTASTRGALPCTNACMGTTGTTRGDTLSCSKQLGGGVGTGREGGAEAAGDVEVVVSCRLTSSTYTSPNEASRALCSSLALLAGMAVYRVISMCAVCAGGDMSPSVHGMGRKVTPPPSAALTLHRTSCAVCSAGVRWGWSRCFKEGARARVHHSAYGTHTNKAARAKPGGVRMYASRTDAGHTSHR